MTKMLNDLQLAFEPHSRYYAHTEEDHIWIPSVAGRGWVIISGDKGLESDGINRKSVIESKAKVFILADSNSRGAEWAASLVLAYKKIVRLSLENVGPFYCRVNKGSDSHVGDIRFYEGGHPIPKVPGAV